MVQKKNARDIRSILSASVSPGFLFEVGLVGSQTGRENHTRQRRPDHQKAENSAATWRHFEGGWQPDLESTPAH